MLAYRFKRSPCLRHNLVKLLGAHSWGIPMFLNICQWVVHVTPCQLMGCHFPASRFVSYRGSVSGLPARGADRLTSGPLPLCLCAVLNRNTPPIDAKIRVPLLRTPWTSGRHMGGLV